MLQFPLCSPPQPYHSSRNHQWHKKRPATSDTLSARQSKHSYTCPSAALNFCSFSSDVWGAGGTCDFCHYCDKQLWFVHSSRKSIVRFLSQPFNGLSTDRALSHLRKANLGRLLSEVRSQLHMSSTAGTAGHIAVHWVCPHTWKITLCSLSKRSVRWSAWLSICWEQKCAGEGKEQRYVVVASGEFMSIMEPAPASVPRTAKARKGNLRKKVLRSLVWCLTFSRASF